VRQLTLVIRNGRILDGTGSPPVHADVGIANDRIVAVAPSPLRAEPEAEVYDAEGRIVSPGFIDAHAHDDLFLLFRPEAHEKVRQGITTVICGNCGISPAPCDPHCRPSLEQLLLAAGGNELAPAERTFRTFGAYLAAMDKADPGIHFAGLVGHGAVRFTAMGTQDRPPTEAELREAGRLLDQSLTEGAFGLSTGLIYPPGAYAGTGELIRLARHLVPFNAVYATHMRSEGSGVVEALDEAIRIGRESGAKVHVSHHKTSDPSNRGRSRDTLARIEAAREEGLRVTADVYPYRAGSTYLAALLPSWVLDEGPEEMGRRLSVPEQRERLRREMESDPGDRWASLIKGREDYRITLSRSTTRPEFTGLSLAEIACREKHSPFDVVLDLVAAEGLSATVIVHSMAEEDVRRIMTRPYVMFGTDGMPCVGPGMPHPRWTGAFPRILGHYVREEGLLSLPEAVTKMTSLPARTFGLPRKGRIAPGYDADLVVFDPERIREGSSYRNPLRPPEGIDLVLVGGRVAARAGEVTGAGSGRVLRSGRA
jgi:N-acyl-D-amino-acid deacylase